jgi:type I restriction enzyme M protein
MVLKLPIGIFYAQNVSTHVLFFRRGNIGFEGTRDVWIYDLRSGMPRFSKRRQFARQDLVSFEQAFERICNGGAPTSDERDDRLRRFTRSQIVNHLDEVATGWLDEVGDVAADSVPEDFDDILQRMLTSLDWVSGELRGVMEVLAATPGNKLERQKP